jgi:hypothetical protein
MGGKMFRALAQALTGIIVLLSISFGAIVKWGLNQEQLNNSTHHPEILFPKPPSPRPTTDKVKKLEYSNENITFNCDDNPCGECFPHGVVPYIKFIETTGEYAAQSCPDYFVTTLMQAITANGVGNVVLLEIGNVCRKVSRSLGVRHYTLTPDHYHLWRKRISDPPFLHTWDRLIRREPGWHGANAAAYFSSYYRIYAINKWVQERPCVKRVTHMDVDSIVYGNAAEVLSWFPRYQVVAHMSWPTNANHIYTSFSREALQDFIDFCDSGFNDPVMIGHKERDGWGFEFTSDMHALASYFAYNVSRYPCWSFGEPARSFGHCSDFYQISMAGFRSPLVRPSHAPRYSAETVAFPRCNLDDRCAFFSEGLNQNKEGLSKTFPSSSWIQVRWIQCQPFVKRINIINGKEHWVQLWGFHGQGSAKGFLGNYWRPPGSRKSCHKEDCLCGDHICRNCFVPFQQMYDSIFNGAQQGVVNLSLLRDDYAISLL